MLFYLCLCLAVVFTAYVIIRYRRNAALQDGPAVPLVRLLLVLALADTFLLYIPWFFYSWASETGTDRPALFLAPVMIVRLMQTVSLDADYEAALEVVHLAARSGVSVSFLWFYAVVLSYVSVLVPLSGILTALSFFRNRLGLSFALGICGRKKVFYVFSGISGKSLILAESLAETPRARRETGFIFCHTGEIEDQALAERVQAVGGWYTAEEPAAMLRRVLRRKERQLRYCLLEDENRNFDDAVSILKRVGTQAASEASRVRIDLLLHSDELDHLLDAQEKYGVFVRILDQERLAAEDLFYRWPLFTGWEPGEKELSVLLAGEGDMAEELLREMLWLGQTASFAVQLYYLSQNAEEVQNRMQFSCPGLLRPEKTGGQSFRVHFVQADYASAFRDQEAAFRGCGYIIAAGADDEENIRLAMQLRTWFARKTICGAGPEAAAAGSGTNLPFIAVCIRDGRRASRIEQLCVQESREPYNLRTFGTEEVLYTRGSLLQGRLTESLLRIQMSYHLQSTGRSASEEERQKVWQELNQSVYNYRSTEANALYLPTRLFDSGALAEAYQSTGGRNASGEELAILLQKALADPDLLDKILSIYERKLAQDPELAESLAQAEHSRWNAYMASCGWVGMDRESLLARKQKGLGHKDYRTLRHACLTAWENLPAVSEIMTDGKNPARYQDADREMVRRVREFLQ